MLNELDFQTYDVFVTGIDLSANMISIALEKAAAYNDPRVSSGFLIFAGYFCLAS